MAWVLCRKEDVISIHPITASELKDEWSDMVESLIREHLDQPYLGASQVIENEYHNGDGTNLIRVRFPPIISVQAVYISDVNLSADDTIVFSDQIALKSQIFPRGNLNVRLYYTSGSANITGTIRMTAAAMIVAIINYRRRAGSDGSLKWADSEPKAGEETPNANIGLTSHLVRIMRQLLKRQRVRSR